MPSKKQARSAQRRRQQLFEAKLAVRQARRRRRQQITGAVAAGALALGGGAIALMSTGPSASEPTPTPSASKPSLGFPPGYAENREWTAVVETERGALTLSLDGVAAPQAVGSFAYLAHQGYFDGSECHRLVTEGIYVLQCGDPTGTGAGGPGYAFGPVENAPADGMYPAGTVAMARRSGDSYSMGSQFFIVYRDSVIPSDAAGGYTVFGTVTDGLGIVEAIAAEGTESGGPDARPASPVVLLEVSVS